MKKPGGSTENDLTRREREVCGYLVLGWRAKEIAKYLGISHRTVQDHCDAVREKYGVRNTVELVRKVYGIEEFGPNADRVQSEGVTC